MLLGPGSMTRLAIFALSLTTGGCVSGEKAEDGNASEGPGPADPPIEETIEFVQSSPLGLAPSEASILTIRVTPRRLQNVTFEILSESANFDGFIARADSRIREDGTATVEVQAPSSPSEFTVRASLSEGASAAITVRVGVPGSGTISVTPDYGGSRIIRQWTASAYENQTCDALNSYWEDGPLVATGASRATIENVSLGVPIAVTLRGGPLVAGCTTLSSLRADHLEEVVVPVTDRPVDVRTGTLSVSLGVTSSTTGFTGHLEAAIQMSPAAFRDSLDSDAAALLRLMANELGASQRNTFLESIESNDLVNVVQGVYGPGEPISQALRGIFSDAGAKISGTAVVEGELELDGDDSTLVLSQVAGVDPAAAGFLPESRWIVGAEAPDIIVISGTLDYSPFRWLHAIATTMTENVPPSDVLAAAARCNDVGAAIVGQAQGAPFGQCEEQCLEELCASSLGVHWQALSSGEGDSAVSLQVGLSGDAKLFGAARIESFQGSWVGRLGTGAETSIAGPAEGHLILEP